MSVLSDGFRPLIRGLSISSKIEDQGVALQKVSVPSSGDYQFLPSQTSIMSSGTTVSVPSSGDYQFLRNTNNIKVVFNIVSVPSSGDYQFLQAFRNEAAQVRSFRPLIRGLSISSYSAGFEPTKTLSFRPLIRGLSISSIIQKDSTRI